MDEDELEDLLFDDLASQEPLEYYLSEASEDDLLFTEAGEEPPLWDLDDSPLLMPAETDAESEEDILFGNQELDGSRSEFHDHQTQSTTHDRYRAHFAPQLNASNSV
jgi:hypothetical protein